MSEETQEKFYIIWNEARNEAFVTNDIDDARSVVSGEPHRNCSSFPGVQTHSTAGQAFHECYEDDSLKVETLYLPSPQAGETS